MFKIPIGYKSLESEPADKSGALSRTAKQSLRKAAIPSPEVRPVLDYIEAHQDELISYLDVSRGSGVSTQRVGKIVRELVGMGIIVKSQSVPKHGTRYIVVGSPTSTRRRIGRLSYSTNTKYNFDVSGVKSKIISIARATRSHLTTGLLVILGRKG